MKRFGRLSAAAATLIIVLALAGCARYEERIATEVLPEPELYALVMEKINNQDWDAAIATIDRYERLYTSGEHIQELRLRRADARFNKDTPSSLIVAKADYESFLALYPRYEREDYVWLQIAKCSVNQMLPPNRDQYPTKLAITDLENFIARFPDSQYVPEARELLQHANKNLADYNVIVARHYYGRGIYSPAEERFKLALEQEDVEFEDLDRILFQTVTAAARSATIYQRLHAFYKRAQQPDFEKAYRERYEKSVYDARRFLQEFQEKYPGHTAEYSALQTEINQISPLDTDSAAK